MDRISSGANGSRPTYVFSKKWGNLDSALALHFEFYNLCRVYSSLRVTPAMEAGIVVRVWTIEEPIAAQLPRLMRETAEPAGADRIH